VDILLDKVT